MWQWRSTTAHLSGFYSLDWRIVVNIDCGYDFSHGTILTLVFKFLIPLIKAASNNNLPVALNRGRKCCFSPYLLLLLRDTMKFPQKELPMTAKPTVIFRPKSMQLQSLFIAAIFMTNAYRNHMG